MLRDLQALTGAENETLHTEIPAQMLATTRKWASISSVYPNEGRVSPFFESHPGWNGSIKQ